MSWWRNLIKFGAPVAGAALGSIGGGALGLSPTIGGAIGGGLGGVLGSEFGGHGGVGGDLLEGGLGALGGGLAGDTLAGWAGTTPGATSAVGSGVGGQSGSIDDLLRTIGSGSAAEASIPGVAAAGAAPAVAGAAGGAAGAGGVGGNFLDSVLGFAKDNPVLTTAGIGIGGQLLSPALANLTTPQYPGQAELEKNAKMLQGRATGELNGQMSPSAALAYNDAVTSIKAQYANLGLSGSTMEAQDISAAKERAVAASANEGLTELGLSTDLYDKIMGYAMQNDNELSSAVTNLLGQLGSSYGGQRPPSAA